VGFSSPARVFADAVGCRDTWEIALKGFNMIESPLVREWKAAARSEGKIEGKVDALVRVVKGRDKEAPDEVCEGIRACRDPEKLDRWLDVALMVDTLEEFRKQTGL
jgi:hypothetical protein